MSLKYTPIEHIPEETQRVARAAFPKGNPMMTLHDHLPQLFTNEDFAHLYSRFGQSGYAPWRLMLVLIFQFIENLNDRQTANAVSARIDCLEQNGTYRACSLEICSCFTLNRSRF